MKRWSSKVNEKIEDPRIDAFLEEILAVCARHGLSISHEDGHGAFIIEPFSENNKEWLENAMIGEETP